MLLHIPGVLTRDELPALRAALAEAPWIDGRASVGAQGAQVKYNRQLEAETPLAQSLGRQIVAAMLRHPTLVSAGLPRHVLPPFFNAYEGGERYGLHVDGALRELPGGAGPMRSDLSATLFLCEPPTYDGGELVVHDQYGTHEVKLPAGDLILYPAGSLHEVLPVTRGTRWCAFTWLQSLVRDASQRRMLFELDGTIQALRARHGDSAETVALTGQYHNLLRLWALP